MLLPPDNCNSQRVAQYPSISPWPPSQLEGETWVSPSAWWVLVALSAEAPAGTQVETGERAFSDLAAFGH